ncbi:flagellar hook-length control protein FliK [Campylobacter sp. Marseille-Q3452]|uniref:Flagellar hook-length control protein FliK n=1 Tax=Campylobacter massiliensis TaxID=2762557 RepID=A0A842JD54_9BACT|nr:flagellar hook-length control protein FliK [Campylobacter massiliensis]MBC2882984.1 flagellar hook-length control protein FliK [Campylobacter massiliensis]
MESVSNSVSSQIATQAAVSGALPKTGGPGGPGAGQTGQAGETKNLFKNQPAPAQNLDSEAADNAVKDLDKLVNKLLNELKSSPAQAKELAAQAKNLQLSPNLAKDMKSLVALAENEPDLKEFALKLKEFLKPVADLKNAPLNEQIKSSGIMLEANLKEALNGKFNLPSAINKLFGDIKNLSNQQLLEQISTLTKDDSLSTNESFAKLDQILQNAKTAAKDTLAGSPFKQLFEIADKLENAAKFMDKQANAMSSSGLSLNEKTLNNELNKISQLLASAGEKMQNLNSEKLSQNRGFALNFAELKNASKDLTGELSVLAASQDKFNDFAQKIVRDGTDGSEGATLQDKLQNAARKLNFALQIADKAGFEAKNNLDEVGKLIKQQNIARGELGAVTPKSAEETAKVLQNDVKSALLNMQSKSPDASPVKDAASKLLAQIEMHQLASAVAGGVQTYLPYVWEGVEGGNIRFKQGKKQKHYAQIDLNFQNFGQINIMVALSENKYIDLAIATQKEEFKELILSGAKELKRAIGEQGLIVSNFSLKTMPKLRLSGVYGGLDKLDMGFDKKA